MLQCECKNVELLIKLGANLDAQDFHGHSALHIALIRMSQDPSLYQDYKRIMKELLFNGAKRDLETQQGETCLDLVGQLDPEQFHQSQIDSLKVIFTEQNANLCLMKHRPLKKITKSPTVLLVGLCVFLLICWSFYWGMWDGRKRLMP